MPFPATFPFDEIAGWQITRTQQGAGASRSFLITSNEVGESDRITQISQRANRLVDLLWGDGGLKPSHYPGQEFTLVSQTTAYYVAEDGTPLKISVAVPSTRMFNAETEQGVADCPVQIDVTYSPQEVNTPSSDSTGDGENPAEPAVIRAGTYATWKLGWSGQFTTLPDSSLWWEVSNGQRQLPSSANATLFYCLQDYVITWHNVDVATLRAVQPYLRSLQGCVNGSRMTVPGYMGTFDPETLLFMGANQNGQSDIYVQDGVAVTRTKTSLEYTFRSKTTQSFTDATGKVDDPNGGTTAVGWNHMYDAEIETPGTAGALDQPYGWDRAVTADGNPSHKPADLTKLFAP